MPRLTKEQIAARASGMGSTDIVEWCGLAPWEGAGPWRIYNAKTGLGPPSPNVADSPDGLRLCGYPSPSTAEQEWGHMQERIIGEWYCAAVQNFYRSAESTPHPDLDCVFATLDGYTEDRTIEIKNVSGFMSRDWDVTDPDGVPHYVRAQVQIGMSCARRTQCDVVAALAGRPPHVWSIAYDERLAGMLVAEGVKAWRQISERAPPGLDGSDACREYLRVTYPRDERKWLVPSVEEGFRLDQLGQLRAELAEKARQHTAKVKELDTSILAALGDHSGYEGDGWKMTWKVGKGGVRRSRFTATGGSDDE